MENLFFAQRKKACYLLMAFFIFFISLVSAETFGYGNTKSVTIPVNYSLVNVNNSLYWQGHTGTDGSWLTGISTYNSTYNTWAYNQTTPAINYVNSNPLQCYNSTTHTFWNLTGNQNGLTGIKTGSYTVNTTGNVTIWGQGVNDGLRVNGSVTVTGISSATATGSGIAMTSGDSGPGDEESTYNGGQVTITGGAGGTQSYSTMSGGSGGGVTLTGGQGGVASGSATASGAGGSVSLSPGGGALSQTAGITAGSAGNVVANARIGASANADVTGTMRGGAGSGGSFGGGTGGQASGGSTTNTGGSGGAWAFTGGNGGQGGTAGRGTTNVGGSGGAYSFTSGNGALGTGGSSTNTGGPAGAFTLTSGSGGTTGGTGYTQSIPGKGGDFTIQTGNGGDTGGTFTNGNGGVSGIFKLFQGNGGRGAFGTGSNTGGTSGIVQFLGGTGGIAGFNGVPGSGGTTALGGGGSEFTFLAGNGGAGFRGTTTTGGVGGSMTFTAGDGGAASQGTTNNGGAAGGVTFTAGTGGVGATANGANGHILFKSGTTEIARFDNTLNIFNISRNTQTMNLTPHTTNTYSIGSSTLRYLKGWFSGLDVTGNLNQTSGNATINNIYGEMWNKSDTGFATVDLVTTDVYVALKNLTGAGSLNGFSLVGGTNLTAQVSGLYQANAKVSVTAGSPAGEYGMKLYVNETGQNNCYDHFHVGGDQISMIVTCLVRVNAGSNVSIRFDDHANPVTDLTAYAGNVNLVRIGN